MTPSRYQLDIYDWVDRGSGSAIVDAVAGSGKTTTLLEIVTQWIPRAQTVRFFAFNKEISDTLKGKVPRHFHNVTISTYHAGGFGVFLRHIGSRAEVDKRKWWGLLDQVLSQSERKAYGEGLVKLLDLGRNEGVGILTPDTPETWDRLIEQYDVFDPMDYLLPPANRITSRADYERAIEEEKGRVCELAHQLLDMGVTSAQERFNWSIDFTDQLYMPIRLDLPIPQFDWVLVDELQDTNTIQREWIRRSLKPGGRLLGVGDPRQAIYAWRGASHDAMSLVKEEFGCVELPLSVCYRCARKVVEQAQTLVPQIEPGPDAIEGEVLTVKEDILPTLTPKDVILCRNNAPLIETAYSLIAAGVPVRVLGRDIGKGLIKLIEKLGGQDLEAFEKNLAAWEKQETDRYKRQERPDKVQGVEDRAACLATIIDHLTVKTLAELEKAIDGLFGDRDAARLTLSTIHKAKGKEWRRVVIIRQWLIPSRYARTPAALQQEYNLLYVAWTRAQEILAVLDDKPEWLREKEEREEETGEEQEEVWE